MPLLRLSRRAAVAAMPCALLLSGFSLVACAGSSSPGVNVGAEHASEIISESELRSVTASNAYQAIQRLRPQFLRDRNTTSMGTPSDQTSRNEAIVVYLDAARLGGLETLNTIDLTQIHEIRRLSAGEAMQKYGSRQMGTVIAVTLKH